MSCCERTVGTPHANAAPKRIAVTVFFIFHFIGMLLFILLSECSLNHSLNDSAAFCITSQLIGFCQEYMGQVYIFLFIQVCMVVSGIFPFSRK